MPELETHAVAASGLKNRRAIVLRHVAFEDLDALDSVLRARQFDIEYVDVPIDRDFHDRASAADLLLVLGGPIGVYQTREFPFISDEVDVVRERLASGRPVIGICLGAQIMAAALGSKVYAGTAGKEIGWKPLQLTPDGESSPLAVLGQGQHVLHWHGDTFDLPEGAVRLAGTDQYAQQAFAYGAHGLALQFHVEASRLGLERWYVGHIGELSDAGFDIAELRRAAEVHAGPANEALTTVIAAFLDGQK
ncbi:glutamine amidotransferase [soil metagenome]